MNLTTTREYAMTTLVVVNRFDSRVLKTHLTLDLPTTGVFPFIVISPTIFMVSVPWRVCNVFVVEGCP